MVVAGGSGLIGSALADSLARAGHQVVVLTRRARHSGEVEWDGRQVGAWAEELRRADAVVNLAGASIGGGRWTAARKATLRASRLLATDALVAAIASLPAEERPTVLVNASGIDYYGERVGQEEVTEDAPAGGSFLAQLCVEWEAAARRAETLGVRVVLMRTAVVVARKAEALAKMALPFKLFIGGPLGGGWQWFSWIHLEDVVGLYRLAIERADVVGPLNACAPSVPRQRDAAAALGAALGRPSWIPAPAFALRLALGEMADLLLHGRRAVPAKALAAGYRFRHENLRVAMQEAMR